MTDTEYKNSLDIDDYECDGVREGLISVDAFICSATRLSTGEPFTDEELDALNSDRDVTYPLFESVAY